MKEMNWYGVRTVYEHRERAQGQDRLYEERVVLFRASSFDEALEQAEMEALAYSDEGVRYLGHATAFELFDEPGEKAEVFSLMRDSRMEPERYIERFFDTGRERTSDPA